MDLSEQEMHDLEALIDKRSIGSVLDAIDTICGCKEQHIRENWQDRKLAKRWHKLRTPLLHMLDLTHGL